MGNYKSDSQVIRRIWHEDKGEEFVILNNDKMNELLGTYKNKERALEVLDEINNYKDKLEKAHFLGMTESEFVSSTYQMPEE